MMIANYKVLAPFGLEGRMTTVGETVTNAQIGDTANDFLSRGYIEEIPFASVAGDPVTSSGALKTSIPTEADIQGNQGEPSVADAPPAMDPAESPRKPRPTGG